MFSRLVHRYIDPADSLGELLFGMIMALTFTIGARLLSRSEDINPHDLLVAMIGCNVAWGAIDAVLYVIGSIFSRNQRVHFVRRLCRLTTEAEAMAAIREEFGLKDEPSIAAEDHAAFHRVVLHMLQHAGTERARLRRQDFQAAVVIAVLVAVTAIPGMLPFLLFADGYRAPEAANLVQICLLFLIGFNWARHSGANPWRTGLAIVALGVGLVVVSLMLGGWAGRAISGVPVLVDGGVPRAGEHRVAALADHCAALRAAGRRPRVGPVQVPREAAGAEKRDDGERFIERHQIPRKCSG